MDEKSRSSLPSAPPPTRGSRSSRGSHPSDTLEYQARQDPDFSTLQVAPTDGLQVASPLTTSLPEAVSPAYRPWDRFGGRFQAAAAVAHTLPPGHPLADGGRAPSRFETPWEDISLKGSKHEKEARETCCGLRKRTFYILIGVIAFVILGVGLGVGLGLGLHRSSNDSPSASQSASQR